MKLTGTSNLYTPKVDKVNYFFKNIVVDSTGAYKFQSIHSSPDENGTFSTGLLFQLSGHKILDPSGKFIATYNTGETFSISGWLDFASSYRYLWVNSALHRTIDSTISSGKMSVLSIICPESGEMTCDLSIFSDRLSSSIAFSNYSVGGTATGYVTASANMFINSGQIQFYQSYEALLTGAEILAFVDTRYPTPLVYYDNDSSQTNNDVSFAYQYGTTYGQVIQSFTLSRTGLFDSGLLQLIDLNESSNFSGLFDGVWSGDRFVYDDTDDILSLNYLVSLTDAIGNPYPATGTFSVFIPSTGTMMKAEYITGFSLTASGQYMNVPLIDVTGYYYVTGIQQSLQSLLFNSGCTGNLTVTFSGGEGAEATGQLNLIPVWFTGVYSSDTKRFRLVESYTTINVGTGYTLAPIALVNTGLYGLDCFDVPLASGYNQGWFTPFNTYGTLDVEAGWFTGEALCTTGLVAGDLTGYLVTGIDVYNLGTGYNNAHPPRMSFIRTGTDALTLNASGIFYLNTGSLNNMSSWSIQAGVAGTTLSGCVHTGVFSLSENPILTVNIACSGIDITEPITGRVVVEVTTLLTSPVTGYFTYNKYFDTSDDALKKKDNKLITYAENVELNYLLTPSELDALYSSAGYVGNVWPFTQGDFDF